MDRKKYTWEIWEDKTGIQLDTGTFSSYNDPYKRPSDVRFPYMSHTTIFVYDEEGEVKEHITRKQTVKDLPKYTLPSGDYTIHVEWGHIEAWILDQASWSKQTVDEVMNPEFQRGHVWTQEQQITFIEHVLKGGRTGKDIYFNCATWDTKHEGSKDMFCIDGLQRITAVIAFLHNEIPVFQKYYYRDIDRLRGTEALFILHVLDFQTEEDILTYYLQMNDTGVHHTQEELDKVRKMKEKL
jgi:hypothetical protein